MFQVQYSLSAIYLLCCRWKLQNRCYFSVECNYCRCYVISRKLVIFLVLFSPFPGRIRRAKLRKKTWDFFHFLRNDVMFLKRMACVFWAGSNGSRRSSFCLCSHSNSNWSTRVLSISISKTIVKTPHRPRLYNDRSCCFSSPIWPLWPFFYFDS